MAKRILVSKDIFLKEPISDNLIKDEKGQYICSKFREHAERFWLSDPRLSNSPIFLEKLINRIVPAFRKALPDVYMYLEDEDYDVLKPIVENPDSRLSWGNPLIHAQTLPHSKAFLAAESCNLSDIAQETK